MKNLSVVVAIMLMCSNFLSAQEFKPVAGDLSTEVNFSPFSSNPVQLDHLKIRKFLTDKNVVSIGLKLDFDRDEGTETDGFTEVDYTKKAFELNSRLGFERHFEGTKRLSPYAGIELELAYKSASADFEAQGTTYRIDGAWDTDGTERRFTRMSANLIIGADFYFMKRAYLGVELGYGYTFQDFQKYRAKYEYFPADEYPGKVSYDLGHHVQNSIRLGFNF